MPPSIFRASRTVQNLAVGLLRHLLVGQSGLAQDRPAGGRIVAGPRRLDPRGQSPTGSTMLSRLPRQVLAGDAALGHQRHHQHQRPQQDQRRQPRQAVLAARAMLDARMTRDTIGHGRRERLKRVNGQALP